MSRNPKKIFISILSTETNTFSPIPTGLDDYEIIRQEDIDSGSYQQGDDFLLDLWRQKACDRGDELLFGLEATAYPAGYTTQSAYESLRDEILGKLKASGPVDVVLLFLHGAMAAQGYDDCEGDLLYRIRQVIGPDVIIAVELDLHCHLTQAMLTSADILITFKEYPHTDIAARADELYELAVEASAGHYRPTMALFDCHMMGMYPTSTPTMRRFIQTMVETEQREDVLSVSFIHGFPFGDMPEAGGKMLVVTDNNQPLAQQLANDFGMQVFSLRHDITFKALPLDTALEKAVKQASERNDSTKPIVVADQSDNSGAGAPNDSTFALRWLLEHQIQGVACAIVYDPQVVQFAVAAGVGAQLQVRLGGKLGVSSGDPLDIPVTVTAIKRNYFHHFPQETGDPSLFPLGDTVALQCAGIDIIVSSVRLQCYSASIFTDFDLPPSERRILIVKSTQHFYADFAPIASEVIYMAGPGAVSPIVQQVPYQKMSTEDKYPWVDNPFETVASI